MVGEIRDLETAGIAVKAALTGHLVLSTLHTNDAPSTIGRLLNMGIEPFLVASSVVLIVAQRLARKLCPQCKEGTEVPPGVLKDVGFRDDEIGTFNLYKPVGCPECNGMGYKGRVALYEVMKITDTIRDLILNNRPVSEITKTAIEEGMDTLRRAGLNKVKEGLVPIEEVLRVTASV
jgi:type IV pilus assembly protein PilB